MILGASWVSIWLEITQGRGCGLKAESSKKATEEMTSHPQQGQVALVGQVLG